jgi:hypothetical protein
MKSEVFNVLEETKKVKIYQPEFKEIVKFHKEDNFKMLSSK